VCYLSLMHELALVLHSWVRWIVIITGILATAGAAASTSNGSSRWSRIFTIALDVQFLLGLVLLFTLNLFSDMAATMSDPVARFYAVEHGTIMLIAIALGHMGTVLARKAKSPGSARTRALVCYGLATLLILVGTPWPGMRDDRPLFRL
jgi:hypothetical protein